MMLNPWCETEGEETRYCQNGCTHGCCEPETREIPALGHIWPPKWTTESEPCCNVTGTSAKRCLRDASHKQTSVIPALGCDWGEWKVALEACCLETGRRIRYCQNNCDPDECGCCNYSEWEDIAALGHNWSEWTVTVEPGCETDGKESRYCKNGCTHGCCGTQTRDIPALGHIYYIYEPGSNYTTDHFRRCSRDGCNYSHACGVPPEACGFTG